MINIRLYMPSDTTGMVLLWNKAVSDGDSFIQDEALPYIQAGRFFANQNAAVVATDETGMVRGMYTIRSKYSGRCKHICSAVIAVDSEYRRRHIGEKLLNDCINRAASLGFKVIELYPVSASNKAAAALFEKAGFTKTGSIPNGFARGDGQFTDADTYCITLPDHVNEAVNMPGMQPDKGIALRPDERKVEMPGQAAFTGAQIPETGQPMPAAQNMQTQGQLPPVGMNGYTWKSSQGSFTSGQPVQANGNYQRPDPELGQIFEEYEPNKYDCIAVDDEYVQAVAEKLAGVRVYWHGLDRSESGLAYHGITLIPPESIAEVIEAVKDVPEMRRLMEMLVVAERERKFVIHFGV